VHPFGTWVTAKLGQGGTLVLENGTHLHLDNINARISRLRIKALELEGKGFLEPGEKQYLDEVAAQAAALMTAPNWDRKFEACRWLEKAEALVKAREPDQSPLRQFRPLG
jgi:hypothetical protein